MPANDDYKDSRSLTNWTKSFLYAGIAVSVVAFGSNALEYQLLVAMRDGFYSGDAALDASDARQAWVGLLQAAVYLPTMVLVLMWIHRANYNVRQLGARGLRFSPAGSIGWYFVPILTLWRPYQAIEGDLAGQLGPPELAGQAGSNAAAHVVGVLADIDSPRSPKLEIVVELGRERRCRRLHRREYRRAGGYGVGDTACAGATGYRKADLSDAG